MRTVSPAFAPYADVRRVDFRIRFELLDETARGAAVPSVSGQENISQLDQLTDRIEETKTFATLEPGSWILDGTREIMPDDVSNVQTGWWGDVLSDENGIFLEPPFLTFSFGAPIDTVGFSLIFDSDYPTSIRVTVYNQTAVKEQQTFANDRHNCVIDMPVQGYDKVMFEFLSTFNPFRRVRLSECLFGIIQDFDKDNLQSARIVYGADVISESFPSRQLDFTFENLDKKYNLVNPNGLYAYLQQGQDIYTKIDINGESVDMGVFEYTQAQASDDEITAKITANDYVLLSLEGIFNGGSNTTTTLENAINTVLPDVVVSMAYPTYMVSMAIPQGTTKREAIRLLAQASRCSVWIDRDMILQIHPLDASTVDDELNANNMPTMSGISVSEPVDMIELTVRNEYTTDIDGKPITTETIYTSGTGKRVKTINNPCVANGQAVADWILGQLNRRVRYDKKNRGNPAIEICDTLKIYDAYGENHNAVVVSQEIIFDGGLSAKTKAVG